MKKFLEELKLKPTDEELRRYKSNWLRNVTVMNSSRIAKIMLNYRQNGRRPFGRSLKSQLDETEKGQTKSNW